MIRLTPRVGAKFVLIEPSAIREIKPAEGGAAVRLDGQSYFQEFREKPTQIARMMQIWRSRRHVARIDEDALWVAWQGEDAVLIE